MNQLKLGAILNYIVIGLSVLSGLLYTPYMLRMMGQSEYGLYSLVVSIIAYLTVLDLGFGNAITRYTARFKAQGKVEEQYEMFGMFFLLYIVIAFVTVCIGLGLYFNVEQMFGDTMTAIELERAKILLLVLLFNLAFTFPMSIFGSIMYAYECFVFPKVVNIIRVVLNIIVMVTLLEHGYKAVAMAVVQTIFNMLTLSINFLYCKYRLHIHMYFRKFNWVFLKEVSVYSFWIFLNIIMDRIYWSTGQFVLGAVVGTVAVSVFALAIQLQTIYMQFSTAISSLFLPKVTAMVANGESDKAISDLFIKTGRIQFLMMFMILCGFIVFGKSFIFLWAGEGYEDVYCITLLFFASFLTPLIQNMGITILQARNQMRFRSLLYLVISFVALAFEVILSHYWGGIGCAIAVSGALLIGSGLIINIYYQRVQHLEIVCFWKNILRMAIMPAAASLVFYMILQNYEINTWSDWIKWVAVFLPIYGITTFVGAMNKTEKKMIFSIVKR